MSDEFNIRFFRNEEYSLHEINGVVSISLGLTLVFEVFKKGKYKKFLELPYMYINKDKMIETLDNLFVRYFYILKIISDIVLSTEEDQLTGTKINKEIRDQITEYVKIIQKERKKSKQSGAAPKDIWTYAVCGVKDILIEDVNHKSEGKITKEFIEKKVSKIKQKLIDQKYKKKFSNIIVSVIYDGGMRTLAQNIIQDLTNKNLKAYEICFNPDEKSFDTDADVNKAIENYKNPRTRKIKLLNEKLKQDDARDVDEKKKDKDNFEVQVGDSNEKIGLRDVANEFVEEFFTKS
jgi:hypothetical protein